MSQARTYLLSSSHPVALKDDDVEDEEGLQVEKDTREAKQESMDVDDESKRKPKDILPTGKVVGVAKRNWRA